MKEIKENIRMVKNRDLFKKIRDREGMFQAKNGHNKRETREGPNRSRIY